MIVHLLNSMKEIWEKWEIGKFQLEFFSFFFWDLNIICYIRLCIHLQRSLFNRLAEFYSMNSNQLINFEWKICYILLMRWLTGNRLRWYKSGSSELKMENFKTSFIIYSLAHIKLYAQCTYCHLPLLNDYGNDEKRRNRK